MFVFPKSKNMASIERLCSRSPRIWLLLNVCVPEVQEYGFYCTFVFPKSKNMASIVFVFAKSKNMTSFCLNFRRPGYGFFFCLYFEKTVCTYQTYLSQQYL